MAKRKVTDPKVLVDAAARLFERKGYQNTTIEDLAEEVGVSKPTIYQHVKNKGSLLEAIFESVLRRLKDDQGAIIASTDDPGEQFRRSIHYYLQAVVDLQTYFKIFFGQEHELPEKSRRRFRAWGREMTDQFTGILESCVKRGIARSDIDARIAAFLILGMLTSVSRWYDPKKALTPDEIADHATAIIEGYLITPDRQSKVKLAR